MRTLHVWKLSLCVVLALAQSNAYANVELPSFFSDGMVLQRDAKVPIWGKSDKTTVTVTTSWNNQQYDANVGADGKWKIEIVTTGAGGPYSVKVTDADGTLSINNILLGDVWLASGQSNMEMSFRGFKNQAVHNAEETVRNSNNDNIRFFDVKNKSWGRPLDDVEGKWLPASSRNTWRFSAVAYHFAKQLHDNVQVPIAIIQSDWGGTPVEAWMSAESLKPFGRVKVEDVGNAAYAKKDQPTGLYNAMIHPLLGYGIKGVIWYQGESNRSVPLLYFRLFPAMVKQWRGAWGIDFPFYYVQIAPYSNLKSDEMRPRPIRMDRLAPYLRDYQLRALDVIPNSGMAVLMDVGSASTIHPPDKETVGKRLSYIALNKTYGKKDVPYSGPVFREKKITGSTVVLQFDYAEGLYLKNGKSTNFEVAGNDNTFRPAKAVVVGNEVHVNSPSVKKPVAVRYAFKAWAEGDLFNKHDLPASTFKTDDWTLSQVNYE